MSTSLLDMAKQYLTPDIIDKLATFTGESPLATTKAIGGAGPAVLAGMLNSAQDPNGLTQLVNLFQQGKFDGSMLGNLAGAFSGSSMDGLMKMGGPLLGSLFGARSNGLVDLLAGYAGIKKSSATSLLSAAAPFIMSLIGKQLSSKGGISASSLKDLLFSQRSAIAAAAPPGLGQALGIADLSSLGANLGRNPTPIPAPAPSSGLKKLLPILLGVIGLLLLFSLLRSCGGSPAASGAPMDTLNTMSPSSSVPVTPTVETPPPSGEGRLMDSATSGTTSGAPSMAAPATGSTGMGTVTPAPIDTPVGTGAMGGQGASGKKAP
jgi:OmpA-OmpF porin, OOP family